MRLAAMLLAAVLLPACGGGGGGGLEPAPGLPQLVPAGANATVRACAIAPDGAVYIGGDFTAFNLMAVNRLARLDGAFDVGTGFEASVHALAVALDGRVYAGGDFVSYDNVAINRLARLNANGTRDASFATGAGFSGRVRTIAVAPGGDVYIGGDFTSYNNAAVNRLARLNADGARDTTFDVGAGFSGPVRALALTDDGRVYVAGDFVSYKNAAVNRLVRLNADGTRDTAFDVEAGFSGAVHALALAGDGRVYVAGEFTSYRNVAVNRLVRLNADGTRDTSFNVGAGFSGAVRALAVDADGHVYAGGDFTSFDNAYAGRIVRLDGGFDTGAGFSGAVLALATAPGGTLVAAGDFFSFDNTYAGRIVTLGPDASGF